MWGRRGRRRVGAEIVRFKKPSLYAPHRIARNVGLADVTCYTTAFRFAAPAQSNPNRSKMKAAGSRAEFAAALSQYSLQQQVVQRIIGAFVVSSARPIHQ